MTTVIYSFIKRQKKYFLPVCIKVKINLGATLLSQWSISVCCRHIIFQKGTQMFVPLYTWPVINEFWMTRIKQNKSGVWFSPSVRFQLRMHQLLKQLYRESRYVSKHTPGLHQINAYEWIMNELWLSGFLFG